jgi:hypothetical protein
MKKRCLTSCWSLGAVPVEVATWEPYSVMAVDIPVMVTKFMESHEYIDAVREMRSLWEFSWRSFMRCLG